MSCYRGVTPFNIVVEWSTRFVWSSGWLRVLRHYWWRAFSHHSYHSVSPSSCAAQ